MEEKTVEVQTGTTKNVGLDRLHGDSADDTWSADLSNSEQADEPQGETEEEEDAEEAEKSKTVQGEKRSIYDLLEDEIMNSDLPDSDKARSLSRLLKLRGKTVNTDWKPIYYRVDRIINIVEHRKHFVIDKEHDFDEGDLRSKIQFMFPGESRKIRFAYSGKSVQAILDKFPTAKIVDKDGSTEIIEAEVLGTGVNMFLLSQGSTVKALYPPEFVEEMKSEAKRMYELYDE